MPALPEIFARPILARGAVGDTLSPDAEREVAAREDDAAETGPAADDAGE